MKQVLNSIREVKNFREALLLIRDWFLTDRKKLFLIAGAASAILGLITVAADLFLPWGSWGMVARTLLLVPTSVALFVLGYAGAIWWTFFKARDPEWTNVRARFSPTWRQRISAIIAAILLVVIYAVTTRPGYTLTSSVIVAVIIGLFVFMRKTVAEINREELGIPDARDAALNTHLRRRASAVKPRVETRAKAAANAKTEAKAAKLRAKLAATEAELERPEQR